MRPEASRNRGAIKELLAQRFTVQKAKISAMVLDGLSQAVIFHGVDIAPGLPPQFLVFPSVGLLEIDAYCLGRSHHFVAGNFQ
jgi:hypothetical protein